MIAHTVYLQLVDERIKIIYLTYLTSKTVRFVMQHPVPIPEKCIDTLKFCSLWECY
jgi:hypothetical protein